MITIKESTGSGTHKETRYSMKYDHAHGILNLKVTDDTVCLQFRTEYIQDLKKVENRNEDTKVLIRRSAI
ncbi:unnamed protein product [Darwinula stevensoni]|uniref:SRP9 domain-containing protein n=1 Tax=Darwinula stevensoni TaxID=69355 RepID=A0A7R8X5N6_9CRUS|nr:unnamed protein product [Darwinula stevensoni]CAG0880645.1 unnamed protein product [Darwinula stevensoni]